MTEYRSKDTGVVGHSGVLYGPLTDFRNLSNDGGLRVGLPSNRSSGHGGDNPPAPESPVVGLLCTTVTVRPGVAIPSVLEAQRWGRQGCHVYLIRGGCPVIRSGPHTPLGDPSGLVPCEYRGGRFHSTDTTSGSPSTRPTVRWCSDSSEGSPSVQTPPQVQLPCQSSPVHTDSSRPPPPPTGHRCPVRRTVLDLQRSSIPVRVQSTTLPPTPTSPQSHPRD